jgi:hypothetical protein
MPPVGSVPALAVLVLAVVVALAAAAGALASPEVDCIWIWLSSACRAYPNCDERVLRVPSGDVAGTAGVGADDALAAWGTAVADAAVPAAAILVA